MSCLAGHESEKSTIITTGMHRSGTSFTAALLQSAGVDLGQRLMGCHESNPRGHFENRDFVEFHRKVLQSQGINEAGYTLQEKIDVEEHYVEEAQQIISENSISQLWGWKDPRTSLFLDFWADLLPNSLFLMIYRSPWEVVDSFYRRGTDSLILSHPELAVKVWIRYNKKILDFYDNFPERCYLTNTHQVAEDPQGFIEKANAKFKTNLSFPKSEIYDQSLLHKEVSKLPGAALVSHYFPEALDIYRELELRANRIDEDTDVSWFKELNTSRYRIKTFQNWLAIRNLEKERKSIQVELKQTQTQLEQAQAQQQQTQTQLEQTQTEQSRNVEKLIHWIEQLDSLILSMVNSNRWKLGSFFYFIYRKVLFKSLDTPPQEHHRSIVGRIQTWKPDYRSESLPNQQKKIFKNIELNLASSQLHHFGDYVRRFLGKTWNKNYKKTSVESNNRLFVKPTNISPKFSESTLSIDYNKGSKFSRKPFKVLLCSHNLSWQGAQNSLFELAIGYKNSNLLEPIVFSPTDGPLRQLYEKQNISVIVHKFPTNGLTDANKFDKEITVFCEKLQEQKIDVIHVNTLKGFYAILAAHKLSLPCIWNIRESEKPETYFNYLPSYLRESAYNCFKYASSVVFVANATRYLWEHLNSENNFVCINNSIDETRYWFHAQDWGREEARAAFGIEPHEKLLLSIGTVSERKGQKDLIEAYRLLPKELASTCKVFIVGGNDSRYARQLNNKIQKLPIDIRGKIKIIPETSQENSVRKVAEFYLAADLFVFCSRMESYPRVILEAMNFGLPIITTPVFGVTEQVIEGGNALYYTAGNYQMLSQKLQKVISNNELLNKYRIASKARFKRINSHNKMINAYRDLLISCCRQQSTSNSNLRCEVQK